MRVHIRVVVDSDGRWSAAGTGDADDYHDDPDLDTVEFTPHRAYHWIEADVPVPMATVVEGG